MHYYFRKPVDFKTRKKLDGFDSIEFLQPNTPVLIAGSPHWQGGEYRFDELTELTSDYEIADAPDALLALIKRDDSTVGTNESPGISGDLLKEILDEIDVNKFTDHDAWLGIAMGSHHATGGNSDGLTVFTEWSTGYAGKYPKSPRFIQDKWKSFSTDKTVSVTVGSLLDAISDGDAKRKIIEKLNRTDPSEDFDGIFPVQKYLLDAKLYNPRQEMEQLVSEWFTVADVASVRRYQKQWFFWADGKYRPELDEDVEAGTVTRY